MMRFLPTETVLGAESAEDAVPSTERHEARLKELDRQLKGLTPEETTPRTGLLIERGYVLLDLSRSPEAWQTGWEAFELAIAAEDWENAVQACEILFKADQPDSLKALAHGIWLGVTYPVDPELSVAMLHHFVEESPPSADGAAVAATVARYVSDMRGEGGQREDLLFFTGQMLGEVARRHRNVTSQDMFEVWFKHLELDDPEAFLPRLSQMLDALVSGDWWIDRDALRARLPVN